MRIAGKRVTRCTFWIFSNTPLDGDRTEMAYLLDYGVGYFYSINAGNPDAFEKVGRTLRAYVTRGLEKPPLPPVAPLPANATAYAGWYEPDSPRVEVTHFLERLLSLARVRFEDGKLFLTSLGARNQVFLPITGAQVRALHQPTGNLVCDLSSEASGCIFLAGRKMKTAILTETKRRFRALEQR